MDRRVAWIVVASLGAATALLPALAGSETLPAIEAVNAGAGTYGEEHHWSPAQLSVAVGATVSLSNPTDVNHGVYWVGGPAKPSCTPSVPVGFSAAASGTKWSGSCTFATAGVYTFYCTVHGAAMTARVSVGEGGTTTTTSTNPTPSPQGGTGTDAYPPPGEAGTPAAPPSPSAALLSGVASKALRLAPVVHAAAVRGSVNLTAAAAGGSLEVDLLRRHGAHLQSVARLRRSALHAGRLAFTLALDGSTRRSLRSHHRVVLIVRLVLHPVHGMTLRITRSLVLQR